MQCPSIAVFMCMLAGCGSTISGPTGSGNQSQTGAGTSDAAVGPHACNPLEGTDAPISLANVLGAGRHADGTIYVLDEGDGASDYRAFVSQGSVLQRKVVSGTGSADGWITASVADPTSPFTLRIERAGTVVQSMSVVRGEGGSKDREGSGGDPLTVIGKDALSGLTTRNVPANVFVEYDASTSDGHRMIVVRPEVDWKYEDFRVFYGTSDQMLERKTLNASRGSSTYIKFDLDGVVYDAFFPSQLSGDGAGPAKLTAPDGKITVLSVANQNGASKPVGLSFICR